MATVNFLYRSTKSRSTLTLRLRFGNRQLDAKTRIVVSKEYWEKYHNAKRISIAHMKALQTLTRVEFPKLENHVLEAFYGAQEKHVDKQWLANVLEDYYRPQLVSNGLNDELVYNLEAYLEFKGEDLKPSTKKKYRVVKQMLLNYQDDLGTILYVQKINMNFKKDFETFCRRHDYATNTIAKALKIIRTVCKHAHRMGVEISNEFDEVKLREVETEILFLTPEDLEAISNLSGLPEYLDNARDWLLISCYTGQRISDFMRFQTSMITHGTLKNGSRVKLLQFRQSKTEKPTTVPLLSEVQTILDKRNRMFPKPIADQVYNRFIKEVCKKAGITYKVTGSKKVKLSNSKDRWRKRVGQFEKWELVTSHIGRRSFASNYFGKIPTRLLMGATGHKTEQQFLRYIGKNSQDLALELAEYFQ